MEINHGTLRGWVRSALAEAEYLVGGLDRFVQPSPGQVRRLVFVCLGNINRSAFAAAVAARRGATVASIGLSTSTGAPAATVARRVAEKLRIDLSTHAATDITDYDFQPGDLLLVMETRHARRLVERGIPSQSIALLGHWATPHRIHLHDPHTLSERYFATCFTLIHSAVHKLLDQLSAGGSPSMQGAMADRTER